MTSNAHKFFIGIGDKNYNYRIPEWKRDSDLVQGVDDPGALPPLVGHGKPSAAPPSPTQSHKFFAAFDFSHHPSNTLLQQIQAQLLVG